MTATGSRGDSRRILAIWFLGEAHLLFPLAMPVPNRVPNAGGQGDFGGQECYKFQ
jgi:hypothetical protein